MSFDPQAAALPVAVVGAGAMGRGIAQMLAQAGCRVRLHDADAAAPPKAIASVGDALGKLVAKGKLDATARDATMANARAGRRARRSRRLRARRRGDRRAARRQAAAVPRARGRRRRRRGARVEHVVAVDHRDRGGLSASRARRGLALLQPGPADEGRRGDRRPRDRSRGRRRVDGADAALRAHRRPREGHARASSSTTPGAAIRPRRCGSSAKASATSSTSIA